MKMNPRTAKFILEAIAAASMAVAGVVSKYYLEAPKD